MKKKLKEHSLSDEEKLGVLQRNDPFREWASLDETRFCILCERAISGRDIRVNSSEGEPVLACPTPGCAGTLYEWVYLGDPLLSDDAFSEWERLTAAGMTAEASGSENPLASPGR